MFAQARRAFALIVLAACSSDAVNSPTTGPVTEWVVDAITIPVNATQADNLALDLDGDGTGDNQFGAVLAAFTSAGSFDFQAAMDAAIDDGDIVHLIAFQADDATLTDDAAATATWQVGMATAGFSTGPHQVDNSYEQSALRGALSAGNFASRNPATTNAPVAAHLALRLFGVSETIYLPLNGVHVQWDFTGTTGIASGQIHGSIRETDVADIFVPALAASFNAVIQANPTSDESDTLKGLFDIGGCAGATADDGVIAVCELAASSLIQTLLRPDVHIYNASGGYAPNPTNTTKNALSVGVGFTAVPGTF
jgi:hypothetical protein